MKLIDGLLVHSEDVEAPEDAATKVARPPVRRILSFPRRVP